MWKSYAESNFTDVCVIDAELLAIEFLIFIVHGSGFILTRMHPLLRKFLLWIFFGPVTLTLTLTWWPSYTNLTRTAWRCANINFIREVFRKLTSDRQTDRHTYRQSAEIYRAPAACRELTKSTCEIKWLKIQPPIVQVQVDRHQAVRAVSLFQFAAQVRYANNLSPFFKVSIH